MEIVEKTKKCAGTFLCRYRVVLGLFVFCIAAVIVGVLLFAGN